MAGAPTAARFSRCIPTGRIELIEGVGFVQEPPPLRAEPIHAAGQSHGAQNLLDFHQDVGHLDGGGDTLEQGYAIQPTPVVFLRWVEQEQIGQPLLGDEPLEIAHITIRHARGASAHHVEARDFIGRAALTDLQQLPDADGQGKAFAARGEVEAPFQLISVQRTCLAHIQPQPAGRPGQIFRMVVGKVREADFDPRVVQLDSLSIGSDNPAAAQLAQVEWFNRSGLPRPIVGSDVQKCFQAGLDAGVGGMGVNLKDKVGF